jgi:membrane protein insertase Oxa1/YidC/SpoIIIJ
VAIILGCYSYISILSAGQEWSRYSHYKENMEIIILLFILLISNLFLFKKSENSMRKFYQAQIELDKQKDLCNNIKSKLNLTIEKNKVLEKKNAEMIKKLNDLSSFLSKAKNGTM